MLVDKGFVGASGVTAKAGPGHERVLETTWRTCPSWHPALELLTHRDGSVAGAAGYARLGPYLMGGAQIAAER